MPVNDNDIELLDTYLDGELPVDQCEALWRRFSDEPELALELERCRADRTIRQTVFASMEPSELAAERTEIKIAAARRVMMSCPSSPVRHRDRGPGGMYSLWLHGRLARSRKYTTTVPGAGSPNFIQQIENNSLALRPNQIRSQHPGRTWPGRRDKRV